jgi:hypothetical protein
MLTCEHRKEPPAGSPAVQSIHDSLGVLYHLCSITACAVYSSVGQHRVWFQGCLHVRICPGAFHTLGNAHCERLWLWG